MRTLTPPVVKNLLIANCIVYMSVLLVPSLNHTLARYGELFYFTSPFYHTYQFLTYMFLHASFGHLFFNMFALWMFGRELEEELGSRRFLAYYLICGMGAGLIQLLVAGAAGEYYIQLLGASGAVMGLLLAFGVMHPNVPLFIIPFPFPIKAKWMVVGYGVIEFLLGALNFNHGVAHMAHVGGMLWGLAILYVWKKNGSIHF